MKGDAGDGMYVLSSLRCIYLSIAKAECVVSLPIRVSAAGGGGAALTNYLKERERLLFVPVWKINASRLFLVVYTS